MSLILKNQYLIDFSLSIQLVIAFFIGLYFPNLFLIAIVLIIHLLFIHYSFPQKNNRKEEVKDLLYLGLNLMFAYIIGLSISVMESNSKYNFGLIILPLLVLFIFIVVDKNFRENISYKKNEYLENNPLTSKRLSIEFENKKYIFKNNSLILFAIGTPLVSYLIYLFFDLQANYWLHEIVVKQTVYLLNLFFNMGAEAIYNPIGNYHWSFIIPGKSSIYFETFCTGIQAICVFAGLILFIPHSQDKETNRNIIWRKAKSLIVSSIIFYVVNIIRMLIQIYLYYIGYPWESIHVSISAASSFIAAIIILLLHKWIPEFIISIIYSGTLIKEKLKSKDSSE
jgi:exosortase/archaeosortase family protein